MPTRGSAGSAFHAACTSPMTLDTASVLPDPGAPTIRIELLNDFSIVSRTFSRMNSTASWSDGRSLASWACLLRGWARLVDTHL